MISYKVSILVFQSGLYSCFEHNHDRYHCSITGNFSKVFDLAIWPFKLNLMHTPMMQIKKFRVTSKCFCQIMIMKPVSYPLYRNT